MSWQELTYYDPFTDTESKRLSLFDSSGLEFYTTVTKPGSGKRWRELRAELLERLADAIEAGVPPGEVKR
jgi:hypothetical protein